MYKFQLCIQKAYNAFVRPQLKGKINVRCQKQSHHWKAHH